MNRTKGNKTALHRILSAASGILGLLFAVLLTGTVYAEYLLSKVRWMHLKMKRKPWIRISPDRN